MPLVCLAHGLGLMVVDVGSSSLTTALHEMPHASAGPLHRSDLSPFTALSATRLTPGYTGPGY